MNVNNILNKPRTKTPSKFVANVDKISVPKYKDRGEQKNQPCCLNQQHGLRSENTTQGCMSVVRARYD